MNTTEYYSLLGLKQGASIAEIKKAYRAKALFYHPDRNSSPEAADLFVKISEAYQYLLHYHQEQVITDADREKAYNAWMAYRREKARQEAENYAKASYAEFKRSQLYKSTQAIDGKILVLGFLLSIFIMCYSIYGYSYRVAVATNEKEMPSLLLMLLTLGMGLIFLIITLLYFLAWKADKKKKKEGKAV